MFRMLDHNRWTTNCRWIPFLLDFFAVRFFGEAGGETTLVVTEGVPAVIAHFER